jgi:hypothetical protein
MQSSEGVHRHAERAGMGISMALKTVAEDDEDTRIRINK